MNTAGIALDDWKLPIFQKHLDAGDWKYDVRTGLTEGTSIIHVQYHLLSHIQPVVVAAERECMLARAH